MTILGLDISTSCTGIAVVSNDGTLEYSDYENFKNCNTLWEKTDRMKYRFQSMNEYSNCACGDIQHIYIEESLLMFRPGMSSATTIASLTKFNALVAYVVREVFGLEPVMIPSTTARKTCGIKVQRQPITTVPAKEQVFQWALSEGGPLHEWKFDRSKTGKHRPYVYDQVDAYVIARAGSVLVSK